MRYQKLGQGAASAERKNRSIIQKSGPLLSLWHSPLTLSEFKILDAYLARIDSHHPEKRWVRFSKNDLEELLGVKLNVPDLSKRIDHLAVMVQIDNPDYPDGFDKIALFERAVCEKTKDGWQVNLCCTHSAMKYIFNIDNIGYLRYKLNAVVHLTSRYSYLLFLYLEHNRFRQTWEVTFDSLRDFLGCTGDYYTSFKYFNNDILKRCKKELEEKASCHFAYETIKRGKYVIGVRFTIGLLPSELSDQPEQPEIISKAASMDAKLLSLRNACLLPDGNPEFSLAEIKQLYSVLQFVPKDHMPSAPGSPLTAMICYLKEKYAAINRQAEQKAIAHRFKYLLKMVKNDAGIK